MDEIDEFNAMSELDQLNDIANKSFALKIRLEAYGWKHSASDVEVIQDSAEHQMEKIHAEEGGE